MFKSTTEEYDKKYVGELSRDEAVKLLNSMEGKTPYIFRYSPNIKELVMTIKGLDEYGCPGITHFTLGDTVGKIDTNDPEQLEAAVRVSREFIEKFLSGNTEEKNIGRYLTGDEIKKALLETSYGTKYLTGERTAFHLGKK
ncbi:hypothetical protein A8135_09575 [Legionella jamestowniensis]|uniref:Uncharacterized protein n=1 Tax=Legionella jamestowniensis TaxID=455 RepID=A0ABX2XWG8_9GAMM|nr:hypothetical protein [Legionella jamestowniensis]OCH98992.1 hypothetical protein A8135_09575 [Legionella jamestowniensis]